MTYLYYDLRTPGALSLVPPRAQAEETFTIGYGGGPSKDTTVTPLSVTFAKLVEMFSMVTIGPKDGSYITRCAFKDSYRHDDSAGDIALVVIDGDKRHVRGDDGALVIEDGVPELERMHAALVSLDITHVLHPSWTHGTRPGLNKCRIAIPARLADKKELGIAVAWVLHKLREVDGIDLVDVKEQHVVSQAWFLPRTGTQELADAYRIFHHDGGQPFPLKEARAWWASQSAQASGTPSPRMASGPASNVKGGRFEQARLAVGGRLLKTGDGRRNLMLQHAGLRLGQFASEADVMAELHALAEQHFDPADPPQWSDIGQMVAGIHSKEVKARQANEQLVEPSIDAIRRKAEERQQAVRSANVAPETGEVFMPDQGPAALAAPEPFPGVMAELVCSMLESSRRRQPQVALLAALTAMAACVPGNYFLRGGGRMNLYGLGCIATGLGKEHYRASAEAIVDAAGSSVIGQPASGEGLEDEVIKAGDRAAIFSAVDEVAHLLGAMGDSRAAPYLRTLSANMLKLFSASATTYRTRSRAGLPGVPVKNPCVSFLGFSTPEKLGEAVSEANITDGLLGRMLLLLGDESAQLIRPARHFDHPAEVILQSGEFVRDATKLVEVGTTPEADRELDALMSASDIEDGDPVFAALQRRTFEKIDRIAGVLAVWDRPACPEIHPPHVEWAAAMVRASNFAFREFLRKHQHASKAHADAERVLNVCRRIVSGKISASRATESAAIRVGLIPWSLVVRQSRLDPKSFEQAIKQLEAVGDITREEFRWEGSQRPSGALKLA